MLKKEVKATLVLAGPVVATQLAHISMGFVDTLMVGRLGSEALAGVALGNSIFFTTLVMAMGVVMSVGPMVSQAFGAADSSAVGRSVRQGLWLGVVLSIPCMVVVRNAGPVLLYVGQSPETVELAVAYLRSISWGTLPFLWFVALRSFVEGVSRPRPPRSRLGRASCPPGPAPVRPWPASVRRAWRSRSFDRWAVPGESPRVLGAPSGARAHQPRALPPPLVGCLPVEPDTRAHPHLGTIWHAGAGARRHLDHPGDQKRPGCQSRPNGWLPTSAAGERHPRRRRRHHHGDQRPAGGRFASMFGSG